MSSKYNTDDIYEATGAYDNRTSQWVNLSAKITCEDGYEDFWICETDEGDYVTGDYIICKESDLSDMYYWGD